MRAGAAELRRGDWRKAFPTDASRRCDVLITDPPFSKRTHKGQTSSRRNADAAKAYVTTLGLPYPPMTPALIDLFVDAWAPNVKRWICVFTSHDLIPAWEAAFARHNRYVFAPVACVVPGSNVRTHGDGPSNWTSYLVCARPRGMSPKSGTLKGAYVSNKGRRKGVPQVPGQKPLALMIDVLRDYSRPGELVVDPFAGRGTTLRACQYLDRAATGAEVSPNRYELAAEWLRRPLVAPKPVKPGTFVYGSCA